MRSKTADCRGWVRRRSLYLVSSSSGHTDLQVPNSTTHARRGGMGRAGGERGTSKWHFVRCMVRFFTKSFFNSKILVLSNSYLHV